MLAVFHVYMTKGDQGKHTERFRPDGLFPRLPVYMSSHDKQIRGEAGFRVGRNPWPARTASDTCASCTLPVPFEERGGGEDCEDVGALGVIEVPHGSPSGIKANLLFRKGCFSSIAHTLTRTPIPTFLPPRSIPHYHLKPSTRVQSTRC